MASGSRVYTGFAQWARNSKFCSTIPITAFRSKFCAWSPCKILFYTKKMHWLHNMSDTQFWSYSDIVHLVKMKFGSKITFFCLKMLVLIFFNPSIQEEDYFCYSICNFGPKISGFFWSKSVHSMKVKYKSCLGQNGNYRYIQIPFWPGKRCFDNSNIVY